MLKDEKKDEGIPTLVIQLAGTSSFHRTGQRRIRLDIAAEHFGVQRVQLVPFECKAVSRAAPAVLSQS